MLEKKDEFEKYLSEIIDYVNLTLTKILPNDNSDISKCMRYSVLSGGKRLRPALVILSAEIFGAKASDVIYAACAVEYIHTYSLIHDDLPSMDNDDLRRGIPSSHKKFGEALAILCGDALLTESFNLITKSNSSEKNINEAIKILANYSGYKWMILGQSNDIAKYNVFDKKILKKKLRMIYIQKTAALIIASLKIGAVLVGVNKKNLEVLKNYGMNIGMAFQIIDDIFDARFDNKLQNIKNVQIGRKLTTFSLYNIHEAKRNAEKYIAKAKKNIRIFGKKSDMFIKFVDYIFSKNIVDY
ncbi:MAG: polyprenyl synthetase family protein [Endomicrobium sp.]|jgi:geranylgeranyl diphosphate synthase type II|nr:polyprenyl synthetase family protein [Endomicrobium sp.]